MVVVPPENWTVPAPLTLEPVFNVWVPLKLRVVELLAVKEPVLVPPRSNASMPLWTLMVPVLSTEISIVLVLVPALFWSVPALEKVDTVPELKSKVWSF